MLDDNDIIAPYRRWLLKMATVYMPWSPDEWQDLAQEGYIAMWRSLKAYNPSEGALPAWLTTAAKFRMRECAHRETWTGYPGKRGHRRQPTPIPQDPQQNEDIYWEEMAEGVMMAYHRGEINRVLSDFSPSVREALYRRFWLDEPVKKDFWVRAIPVLKEKLEHLRANYE
jgi:DNA-directed RNA polymerase specialized sigma24 family protein